MSFNYSKIPFSVVFYHSLIVTVFLSRVVSKVLSVAGRFRLWPSLFAAHANAIFYFGKVRLQARLVSSNTTVGWTGWSLTFRKSFLTCLSLEIVNSTE